MKGCLAFPLSEQIADTIATHGADWASWHYCDKPSGPRIPRWQYAILSGEWKLAPGLTRG